MNFIRIGDVMMNPDHIVSVEYLAQNKYMGEHLPKLTFVMSVTTTAEELFYSEVTLYGRQAIEVWYEISKYPTVSGVQRIDSPDDALREFNKEKQNREAIRQNSAVKK